MNNRHFPSSPSMLRYAPPSVLSSRAASFGAKLTAAWRPSKLWQRPSGWLTCQVSPGGCRGMLKTSIGRGHDRGGPTVRFIAHQRVKVAHTIVKACPCQDGSSGEGIDGCDMATKSLGSKPRGVGCWHHVPCTDSPACACHGRFFAHRMAGGFRASRTAFPILPKDRLGVPGRDIPFAHCARHARCHGQLFADDCRRAHSGLMQNSECISLMCLAISFV